MHRPRLRSTVLAFASASLLVLPAFAAPVELDPPDASATSNASSIVDVTVTAGVSGAPNGFTVQWMTRALFDEIGGVWPADETDPNIQTATFLGTPTLNTVDGTRTFLLNPGQVAIVQLGDIFDETGIFSADRDELHSGTEYVFRVKANGDPGVTGGGAGLLPASPYSATQIATTKPHDDLEDCVHTQGYWKNHPDKWPVNSLKLGSVIYTKAELLLIFDEPAAGNGLISMSHQLIAAKLNVLSGAVVTAVITNAIAAADAMIGPRQIPPTGTGFISPSVTSNLNDVLEQFNSDEKSHACQGITATRPTTWGQIKAIYRY
jgi:hypothetical protein